MITKCSELKKQVFSFAFTKLLKDHCLGLKNSKKKPYFLWGEVTFRFSRHFPEQIAIAQKTVSLRGGGGGGG